ncbi:MAG: ATP-dependent DNA helicase RecG [Brevinema sp.]
MPPQPVFTARQASLLARMGIFTPEQLLLYTPVRYDDRRHVETISDSIIHQRPVLIEAEVVRHETFIIRFRGRLTRMPKIVITDGSATAVLVGWGQMGLAKSFPVGERFFIFAKFDFKFNTIQSSTFEYVSVEKQGSNPLLNRIVPIYRLTEGLSQKEIHKIIYKTFSKVELPEIIPPSLLKARGLMNRKDSLKALHYPQNVEVLEKARQYAAYEELLTLRLSLEAKRRSEEQVLKTHQYPSIDNLNSLYEILPFSLTNAQNRVLAEIHADLTKPHPMHRLVQGDVGSGKTIVAFGAMFLAAKGGHQAAFLAPTEVLAFQHYKKIKPMADALGIPCVLLTGSIKQRSEILEGLKSGSVPIVIGTHALFQKDIHYHDLGLVVIDEQHKFGVGQRSALMEKGQAPDLLLMTATPIPRTMTLALYGDLSVSLIDELPPGRKEIETRIFTQADYSDLWTLLGDEISKGRQAFVVCPLINESDTLMALSVEEVASLYKENTPHRYGIIHGKMTQDEKDAVMARFAKGSFDILIATTIIEVGIDIPNATLMIIESAERFGLSQLHQLRGRVGRGGHQSYCLAVNRVHPENENALQASERLEIFAHTNDGFALAEADLKMRGGGELLGVRQTGDGFFRFANLLKDEKILGAASGDAARILDSDPELILPVHQGLKNTISSTDTRYLS